MSDFTKEELTVLETLQKYIVIQKNCGKLNNFINWDVCKSLEVKGFVSCIGSDKYAITQQGIYALNEIKKK